MLDNKHDSHGQEDASAKTSARAKRPTRYERPLIISHSGDEILEELGPAQACYPFNSCGITP
jgi:hypothetical protein